MGVLLPEGTLSGIAGPLGYMGRADCIAAFEFSHRPEDAGIGLPNIELAQRVLDYSAALAALPLFTGKSILGGLHEIESSIEPTALFEGVSANGLKENLGTWGELLQLRDFMRERELTHPLILTSSYNVYNIVRQIYKQNRQTGYGIFPIVPKDLPGSFDPESDQLWTKREFWWQLFAVPRIGSLMLHGH